MIRWNSDHDQEVSFYSMVSHLREVIERIGNASIFGYCTGGITALLFTSFYPKLVNSLSLLATPVDFSKPDIRLLWAKCFDPGFFRRLFKNVPGEAINAFGAALLNYHLPQFLSHREFVEEIMSQEVLIDYWRRLRWIVETPTVPGKVYEVMASGVDLSRIDVPVLNIMAQYDHIVPVASVRALREAISSSCYEEMLFLGSHVGLSVSKKAHAALWPRVAQWIEEHRLGDR